MVASKPGPEARGGTPPAQDASAEALLAEASLELRAAAGELEAALDRAERSATATSAAEALVDAVLGLVEGPVLVLDVDLRVIAWNTPAERRWSRPGNQALGLKWSRVKRSVDDTVPAAQLDEVFSTGRPGEKSVLGSLAVRPVGGGGSVRYLLVSPVEER